MKSEKHFCLNHLDRKAQNFCYNCKNYFCVDCLNKADNYFYCKNNICHDKYLLELNKKYGSKNEIRILIKIFLIVLISLFFSCFQLLANFNESRGFFFHIGSLIGGLITYNLLGLIPTAIIKLINRKLSPEHFLNYYLLLMIILGSFLAVGNISILAHRTKSSGGYDSNTEVNNSKKIELIVRLNDWSEINR